MLCEGCSSVQQSVSVCIAHGIPARGPGLSTVVIMPILPQAFEKTKARAQGGESQPPVVQVIWVKVHVWAPQSPGDACAGACMRSC